MISLIVCCLLFDTSNVISTDRLAGHAKSYRFPRSVSISSYHHAHDEKLITIVIGSPVVDARYSSQSSRMIGSLVTAWQPKYVFIGADRARTSLLGLESNTKFDAEVRPRFKLSQHASRIKLFLNGIIAKVSSTIDFISVVISAMTNLMKTDLRKFEDMENKVEADLNKIHVPTSGICYQPEKVPAGSFEAVLAAKEIRASIILCEQPLSEAMQTLRGAILRTRSMCLNKLAMEFKVLSLDDLSMASKEHIFQAICCSLEEVVARKGEAAVFRQLNETIPLIWDILTRERADQVITQMAQQEALLTHSQLSAECIQVKSVILVPRFIAPFVGERLRQRLGFQNFDGSLTESVFLAPYKVEIEGCEAQQMILTSESPSHMHHDKNVFAGIIMEPLRNTILAIAAMGRVLLANPIAIDKLYPEEMEDNTTI